MKGNKSKRGVCRVLLFSSLFVLVFSFLLLLFFSRLHRDLLFNICGSVLSFQLFFGRRNDPALPVDYAMMATCAGLLGFMKPHLASLPFIIVAHAGPVRQSTPKLTKSSALLLGSGVADRGLRLALVFILILLFLVTVCD